MILFLRSSDLGIDSRLRRYCRALRLTGIAHTALIWDRNGQALGDGKTAEIRYSARQGKSKRWAIGFRLLGLNLFALRTMWRMRGELKLVHAVDLDTVLAAWLFSWISGVPFVYDIYDHYPDSRGIFGWKRRVIDWLEGKVIAKAARVILADELRTAQHQPIASDRLMIIQNVPDIDQRQPARGDKADVVNMHLKIGYLGTLEPKFRGLEDILAVAAAMPGVELHLGGSGALEPLVKANAAKTKRVIFYGPLAHHDGLEMLARCDVLLGLYYSGVANHKFAAPNKYFEHLLLGKPMLTSLGTPPGAKVARDGTGWVIADGADAIEDALTEMQNNAELLGKRGGAAAKLWRRSYADYFETEIAGRYVDMVRQLTGLCPPLGQVLPFPRAQKSSSECVR